ncbi:MAG: hypothetical protein N3D82_03270 [Ignisphaera sp.]|nr:hypothetical protein [Ignisphaera sp.]MDW8085499.1 hypothetical protein [Ignisphaera sp.]
MDFNVLRVALIECYHRYGQKLLIVLRTAIAIARENRLRGGQPPGDFDYRTLVERLSSAGFHYAPSLLLRALEREYGVVETTYRSSNQHWYRFKDLESTEQALNYIAGVDGAEEDPEVAMVRIQIKALQIRYWLGKLKSMSVKARLGRSDVELFRRFSFHILPKLVRIMRRAEEYEDQLYTEIGIVREIVSIAQIVAERINQESPYTAGHSIGSAVDAVENGCQLPT